MLLVYFPLLSCPAVVLGRFGNCQSATHVSLTLSTADFSPLTSYTFIKFWTLRPHLKICCRHQSKFFACNKRHWSIWTQSLVLNVTLVCLLVTTRKTTSSVFDSIFRLCLSVGCLSVVTSDHAARRVSRIFHEVYRFLINNYDFVASRINADFRFFLF